MTTCFLTDTEDLCPNTCAKEGRCLWRYSEIVEAKPVAEEDGLEIPAFLDRRKSKPV